MTTLVPWLLIALLGVYHGVNPAMGWLFAVALGLQKKSRRAMFIALAPIALGHEASVTLTLALVGGAEALVAPATVRLAGAVILILFGAFKLLRPRSHPRWVGMRVTILDLVAWSFLMSTAHGAGLMLFPILIGLPAPIDAETAGAVGTSVSLNLPGLIVDGAAVALHTACMLVVMAIISYVVYEKIGLAILRRAWFNLDTVWSGAVLTAGFVTLFTGF
jgi:hypothetical protein